MKISKQAKAKNRQKLVASAVKLMQKKGYRATTLREIGKQAGLGEATVYKYFASKMEILYAYFEIKMDVVRDAVEAIPDFDDYSFREKFQAYMETKLALLEPDRKFIEISFNTVFMSDWIGAIRRSRRSLEDFYAMVETWMQDAVRAEEFPDPPLRDLVQNLLWDYHLGITFYWLKDRSDKHMATTQLLDTSLDLIVAALRCDVLGKAADVARFLVRQHLLSALAKDGDGSTDNRIFGDRS